MGKIRIDPAAYLLWAVLLLILPLKWLLSAAVAALIHELGHILAVRLTGGTISAISVHPCGAEIETPPMEPAQELICALAGPVSGLFLLLFVRRIPLIALCAVIQSAYNLLPIYPFDGGRALKRSLELLLPCSFACKLFSAVEIGCGFVLLLAAIAGYFCWNLGIIPIILFSGLAVKLLGRKIPCKSPSLRVQ